MKAEARSGEGARATFEVNSAPRPTALLIEIVDGHPGITLRKLTDEFNHLTGAGYTPAEVRELMLTVCGDQRIRRDGNK
ncbi:MAG: hypothetical protein L0220_22950 [Acidobacteria bacterium]|nr:hypothetical protein [Acidobacteriota bacterium]